MQPDPTIPQSFGNGFDFIGNVIFQWIPATITTLTNNADPSVGTTTLQLGNLQEPIGATQVPEFIQGVSAPGVYDAIAQAWYGFVLIALAISIPFIAIAIYCSIRIYFIRQQEEERFRAAQQPVVMRDVPKTQLRWNRILEQSRSSAEHDWRLAILEADIMLNDLLDIMGYKGETMGDKMKQVDRADFNSIDDAWEAHKIRNAIAHEGSTHALTQRETRRIIGLYANAFKEFGYIQ